MVELAVEERMIVGGHCWHIVVVGEVEESFAGLGVFLEEAEVGKTEEVGSLET